MKTKESRFQVHDELTAPEGSVPILKGAQMSLNFENILDAKQSVHDQNGVTPQAYQRDYLDPLGRTVRIGFRKLL